MELETARALSALTTDFYQRVSASFGATRQAPWPGWERVLEATGAGDLPTLRVIDLACGNLRFERFLAERVPNVQAWVFDACDALMEEGVVALGETDAPCELHVRHLDVAEALFADDDLSRRIDVPPADLSVCFGFMHHVALPAHRTAVLRALVAATRPGGHVAVSLWQLERSPRLMAKALPVPDGDSGDYLLGWQDEQAAQRYCHSFSEDEVDELVQSVAPQAEEVARFSADGRTGDLNRYLVLRRH